MSPPYTFASMASSISALPFLSGPLPACDLPGGILCSLVKHSEIALIVMMSLISLSLVFVGIFAMNPLRILGISYDHKTIQVGSGVIVMSLGVAEGWSPRSSSLCHYARSIKTLEHAFICVSVHLSIQANFDSPDDNSGHPGSL